MTVPNVVGQSKGAAENKLRTAGLKFQVVPVTSTSFGPNTVVSQSPRAPVSSSRREPW